MGLVCNRSGWCAYRHSSSNQTILAGSSSNFQLLDYYRFSTNYIYLKVHYDHYFNGFFFDKVPLLRQLKWHEVTSLNCLTTTYAGYYPELGAGIEHIFKVMRENEYLALQSGQRLGTDGPAGGRGLLACTELLSYEEVQETHAQASFSVL